MFLLCAMAYGWCGVPACVRIAGVRPTGRQGVPAELWLHRGGGRRRAGGAVQIMVELKLAILFMTGLEGLRFGVHNHCKARHMDWRDGFQKRVLNHHVGFTAGP